MSKPTTIEANAIPLSRPAWRGPPTSALITKKMPTQPYAPTPATNASAPAAGLRARHEEAGPDLAEAERLHAVERQVTEHGGLHHAEQQPAAEEHQHGR